MLNCTLTNRSRTLRCVSRPKADLSPDKALLVPKLRSTRQRLLHSNSIPLRRLERLSRRLRWRCRPLHCSQAAASRGDCILFATTPQQPWAPVHSKVVWPVSIGASAILFVFLFVKRKKLTTNPSLSNRHNDWLKTQTHTHAHTCAANWKKLLSQLVAQNKLPSPSQVRYSTYHRCSSAQQLKKHLGGWPANQLLTLKIKSPLARFLWSSSSEQDNRGLWKDVAPNASRHWPSEKCSRCSAIDGRSNAKEFGNCQPQRIVRHEILPWETTLNWILRLIEQFIIILIVIFIIIVIVTTICIQSFAKLFFKANQSSERKSER